MFEVDVKNVTEEWRGGGGDQLGFGVLMPKTYWYLCEIKKII